MARCRLFFGILATLLLCPVIARGTRVEFVQPDLFAPLFVMDLTVSGEGFTTHANVSLIPGDSGGSPFVSFDMLPTVNYGTKVILPNVSLDGDIDIYYAVRLVAVDTGNVSVLDRAVYVTENCPTLGMYGVGHDCRVCPRGGLCPGGNRIWPLPGYWNPGEDSGYVLACPVPSSCLGGLESSCSPGYMGWVCALCEKGFAHVADGRCVPEGKIASKAAWQVPVLLLALAIIAGVFFAGRTGSLFLLPFFVQLMRMSQAFAFVLFDVRQSYTALSGVGPDMLVGLAEVIAVPFTGYLPFYRPVDNPVGQVFVSLLFTVLHLAALLAVPAWVRFRGANKNLNDGTSDDGVVVRGLTRRAVVAWLWVMLVPHAVITLRTFPCSVGQAAFSVAGCGSAGHVAAAVLGALVLAGLAVVWFVTARGVWRTASAPDELPASREDYLAHAFVYGMCRAKHVRAWLIDLVPSLVVIVWAVIVNAPRGGRDEHGRLAAGAGVLMVPLLASSAYIAARRPFVDLASWSQILHQVALIITMWSASTRAEWSSNVAGLVSFLTIASILAWVAAVGLGAIAMWKSRSNKGTVAYPAGYGAMDTMDAVPTVGGVDLPDLGNVSESE